ncbi:Glycyl-glycine endopeptidase ALE-1 [bacterium HR12]|nr:Glycyl-glycine endopeptidase ALE-1 [bacterium HR12]
MLAGGVRGSAHVGPDVRLVAIRGALFRVEARLDLAAAAVAELEGRAEALGARLAGLRDAAIEAERRLRTYEIVRERRRSLADEVVETGRVPGHPEVPETVADLRAPLVVVGKAMRANDRLGVAILAERAATERRLVEVRGLLAGLREEAATLAELERRVRAELADATAEAASLGAAAPADAGLAQDAAVLIDRAREELARIDRAREELRARERELLEEASRLGEALGRLRRELRGVRRANRALTEEMALAELLVAARLGQAPDLVGEVEIALDGVLQVCPVDQPMAYTDNWHAPRWSGGFHLHEGIDIFAPPGTPVRAPFDGVAVVADNPLGGIAVKVFGEVGYVYGAHLSERGALGEVRAGDVIGYVGETGNASGPHLHFEYHPLGGEAVNPFPFLNAVC